MLMASLQNKPDMDKEKDYYPMRKREEKENLQTSLQQYYDNKKRFEDIKEYKNLGKNEVREYPKQNSGSRKYLRKYERREDYVRITVENTHSRERERVKYSSPYEKYAYRKSSLADLRYSREGNSKFDIGVKDSDIISPINKVNTEFTVSQLGIENTRPRNNRPVVGEKSSDYITENEKKELIKSISAIVENHRMLEQHKKILAMRPDFIPSEAFSIFNDFQRDYVTKEDLKSCLQLLKVSMNPNDAANLVKSFDQDKDNHLNYEEFQNMILPKSKKYRSKIAKKEACDIESFDDYSIKTRKAIRDVLNLLTKSENFINFETELIKENLGKLVLEISNNVMKRRKTKVDADDIGDILADSGLDVTYRELREVLIKFGF